MPTTYQVRLVLVRTVTTRPAPGGDHLSTTEHVIARRDISPDEARQLNDHRIAKTARVRINFDQPGT